MKSKMVTGFAVVVLILTAGAIGVQAQEQEKTDPGVARISLIHGDVSTLRGDSGDWAAAALNAPIVNGDRISTGDESRAELQLDFANILRLGNRSQATVVGLSRTQIQVQLGQGLATYSVFRNSEADVEIDTPNASVHPARKDGSFRILVVSDDETQVTAGNGEADIATPQGSTHLRKGEFIVVKGTDNETQYKISEANSKDEWDRWNNDRDNVIKNAEARRNTNGYYVGSEDLDAYGRWTTVPDYGAVWVPAVSSGWAPYRAGRWVWEPYWGWTWVSSEPWGWAPYHYGRWFWYGSSWVWWPGPVGGHAFYRPVWAPAYVSFFGFGGGVGFSAGFGFGSVGWMPIGPCDGFHPWWGPHRTQFNTVNVTNITNVTNVTNIHNVHNGWVPPLRTGTQYSNLRLAMTNERIRGAVSTVPANQFGTGRVLAQPVSGETFRNGRVVQGNLPVVPTRQSLLLSEHAVAPSTIRGAQPQRFFGSENRPVARPQSFDREAADIHNAIQRDGRFQPIVATGQPSAVSDHPRAVPQARPVENAVTLKGATPQAGAPQTLNSTPGAGWRRMGTPEQAPTARSTAPAPTAAGGNEAWRNLPNGSSRNTSHGAPGAIPNGGSSGNRVTSPTNTDSWRRVDHSTEPANHEAGKPMAGTGNPVQLPAVRDRNQGESSAPGNDSWRRPVNVNPSAAPVPRAAKPAPGAEQNDSWRRAGNSPAPQSTGPINRSEQSDSWRRSAGGSPSPAPQVQHESGSWRQPAAHNEAPSRPPLDMRQPIVTRPSGGGSSGSGSSGGYHGSGGSGTRPSAPSSGHGSEQHSSGSGRSGRGR